MRHELIKYGKAGVAPYSPKFESSESMQFAHFCFTQYAKKEHLRKDAKILEIGCGWGQMLQKLASEGYSDLTGASASPEDVERAKQEGINVIQADMHELPFDLGTFDVIIASHVFEHTPAPFIALAEWSEMLKVGGHLLILTPDQEEKWAAEPHHFIVPTPRQMKYLALKAGFEVLTCDYQRSQTIGNMVGLFKKEKYWNER